MISFQFKKDDKTVTIIDKENCWNYKKEFGSTLVENFDVDDNAVQKLYKELKNFGYIVTTDKDEAVNYSFVDGYNFQVIKTNKNISKIITSYGDVGYYKSSLLHREDGPALIYRNGLKCYYIYGNRRTEEEFNQKYGQNKSR